MEAAPGLETPIEVLEGLTKAADALLAEGLDVPGSVREAKALVGGVEALARRVESLRVAAVAAVDASQAHLVDGHRSAHTFHAHHGKLSGASAGRLRRRHAHLAKLPILARLVADGEVSTDHVDRVCAALSNRRAHDALLGCDRMLADQATRLHHKEFSDFVADLERAADPDGAREKNERAHERRDFRLDQGFDTTWESTGGWAALEGAELRSIHDAFYQAELDADLDEARARLGDDFTMDDLRRTPNQRRADALLAMGRAAAAAGTGVDGSKIVTNVVIDGATFEREIARLAGAEVTEAAPGEPVTCQTLNGDRLDPTEAVAVALVNHVRRVVIGSDGVVIDLGREQRLFTGNARLAAMLSCLTCYWPGCGLPVTRCEIDHLDDWQHGGRTDQDNGGPGCKYHHRTRHRRRIRIRRRPDGTWHLAHPDGSVIE